MKRLLVLWLLLSAAAWAQPERYVLADCVIHDAVEEAFPGYVVINGDKIERVGKGAPPGDVPVVDLGGGHLYPALIDADSAIGLVDVESLRATSDYQDVGELNPNLVARYAFRAESETVSVARSQGVLYSGVNPRGALIAGQGSVMKLWGWTWEDMTVSPLWALSVDWPDMTVPPAAEKKKRQEALEKLGRALYFLDDAFEQAKHHQDGVVKDVKWDALKPYAQGQAPVLLRVSGKDQIRSALDWSSAAGVKPVLVCGRDIHYFTGELKERGIPVIYSSEFNHNPLPWERYDLHYRVPGILTHQGVTVALSANGLAFDTRELRDLAGRTRPFGLNEVEALRTITLNPARILGLADHLGSIEAGKQASLILCTGDLLEVGPAVTRAWGEGREIDIDDPQKELYRKYRARIIKE